eukprot:COSAG03_NODE_5181_length_1323_cov_2.581699_1_plen_154_part_00
METSATKSKFVRPAPSSITTTFVWLNSTAFSAVVYSAAFTVQNPRLLRSLMRAAASFSSLHTQKERVPERHTEQHARTNARTLTHTHTHTHTHQRTRTRTRTRTRARAHTQPAPCCSVQLLLLNVHSRDEGAHTLCLLPLELPQPIHARHLSE